MALERGSLTRPGDAGPQLPTPEAQCPGVQSFEYAMALAGDISDGGLVRLSHDYRFGLLAGPDGVPTGAPLQLHGRDYCLAALKGAEDGDGLILRVYNPGQKECSVGVLGGFEVERCRLDEEPDTRPFEGVLRGGEIASLRLRKQVN